MGWFDVTLVILDKPQDRDSFLPLFNERLKSIDVKLCIEDGEFICYNNTRSGEEREITDLYNGMKTEDVLMLLAQWPGLGILCYHHPNFSHYITLDYLTWDDNLIYGFTIGFNGKEVCLDQKKNQSRLLIEEIIQLIDYKCVVGNIDNVSNTYINTSDELSSILGYIEKTTFEFDKRKSTTNTM